MSSTGEINQSSDPSQEQNLMDSIHPIDSKRFSLIVLFFLFGGSNSGAGFSWLIGESGVEAAEEEDGSRRMIWLSGEVDLGIYPVRP
ncbi:hypothetical protein U1Q18_011974, partial [Sarracenia purpurea var. burkii]